MIIIQDRISGMTEFLFLRDWVKTLSLFSQYNWETNEWRTNQWRWTFILYMSVGCNIFDVALLDGLYLKHLQNFPSLSRDETHKTSQHNIN